MAAPNKSQREKCWLSRDEYWKCVETNGLEGDCKNARLEFEKNCTAQWVKYFDRRREYLKFQDKMQKEGYEPINQSN